MASRIGTATRVATTAAALRPRGRGHAVASAGSAATMQMPATWGQRTPS